MSLKYAPSYVGMKRKGVLARLYHKQQQAKQNGLGCFFDVCKINGWDVHFLVWILEIQYRKPLFKELQSITTEAAYAYQLERNGG